MGLDYLLPLRSARFEWQHIHPTPLLDSLYTFNKAWHGIAQLRRVSPLAHFWTPFAKRSRSFYVDPVIVLSQREPLRSPEAAEDCR